MYRKHLNTEILYVSFLGLSPLNVPVAKEKLLELDIVSKLGSVMILISFSPSVGATHTMCLALPGFEHTSC